MTPMRLVVAGAAGRMGRALVRVVAETQAARLVAALTREGSPLLGQDAGALAGCGALGVLLTSDPLRAIVDADAILDFTTPALTLSLATLAAQARVVHVIGTTGFAPGDLARLSAAARHAVVVRSGNMSLGVNLLAALVEQAARALGPEFDVEIVEMHHRLKVDAPSGTALLLGEAAAKGRGIDLAGHAVRMRDGHTGVRPEGAIGFATLRGGTVVGEHSVIFAGTGERLVLSHAAEDRAIFARGAVKAALWGRGRKAGLYTMRDVLGLG
ncbi:4-hydroxy-tetrahydrodipicolinate reductase [Methylocella sp.]|uniref:4-hydroxy-tetrahydrodipicolinate reductase n=1 Tax=Methylocella sp. TaxID=1978226 RepID=UPI0037831E79